MDYNTFLENKSHLKLKKYKSEISATVNRKGVLDIDSVKGCSIGMSKYPNYGCYGVCYAAKISKLYKYDFTNSISRKINYKNTMQLCLFDDLFYGKKTIINTVKNHKMEWFRIGTMGDPCHDWQLTVDLCLWLCRIKIPVIITKHWNRIPKYLLPKLKQTGTIINTSISPLDTIAEIKHRLNQFKRLKRAGIKSILRIVSCRFGKTENGIRLNELQKKLFLNKPIIDNPLRIEQNDYRVTDGLILIENHKDLNSKRYISIVNKNAYIGKCLDCPDQCGLLL
jgi:hypothetical protein